MKAKVLLSTTMTMLAALAAPAPVWAAPHSDAWCADAVDFAMRTVERREIGKSQEYVSKAIDESPEVFKQQYPDLELTDMQDLVAQVFKQGWTRFSSAKAVTRACTEERRQATPETQAKPTTGAAS